MPIDIAREALLTPAEAARSLPGRVAPSTIWRWYRRGVRGVRLESVLIGGKRFVSAEALARFAAVLTAANELASASEATAPERDPCVARELNRGGLI